MKEAIAYGLDEKDLTVWYDLGAMREAIPLWEIPSTPVWENTKSWYKDLKLGLSQEAPSQKGRGRGTRGSSQTNSGRGRARYDDRYDRYESHYSDDRE